ncbi:MAG: hypothetical protein RML12_08800 [Xanthomonadales bacterium]|nr:hypothetical protein [Xanthomonadales bacterium]
MPSPGARRARRFRWRWRAERWPPDAPPSPSPAGSSCRSARPGAWPPRSGSARCPSELWLPLRQHQGLPAEPAVEPGQEVLAGELLARAPEGLGAAVHAPTSGRVLAIAPRPAPQPPFAEEPCVVLAPDGRDRWRKLPPIPRPLEAPAERIVERIAEAGIVGLGGAVFPTSEKLAVPRELLIVNGAECEPYIACDDALLRARAHSVIQGARIAAHAVGANRVMIAVEDHMAQALRGARQGAGQRARPAARGRGRGSPSASARASRAGCPCRWSWSGSRAAIRREASAS